MSLLAPILKMIIYKSKMRKAFVYAWFSLFFRCYFALNSRKILTTSVTHVFRVFFLVESDSAICFIINAFGKAAVAKKSKKIHAITFYKSKLFPKRIKPAATLVKKQERILS